MDTSASTRHYFVNSYRPLAFTRKGRISSESKTIPPFVDGSIRREPDFENQFPSISCLCRTDKFAPRLRVEDIVAYMTVKGRYDSGDAHRRLTAVLQVSEIFPTHRNAADWYRQKNVSLPNNCLVPGNRPKPLNESHQHFRSGSCSSCTSKARTWDLGYQKRARQYPVFVVCRTLFVDLSWQAPVIEEQHLIRAFGRVLPTRNPPTVTETNFRKFLTLLPVSVSL